MSEHKHGERRYISSIHSELSDVRQFRAGGLNNRSGTVRGGGVRSNAKGYVSACFARKMRKNANP